MARTLGLICFVFVLFGSLVNAQFNPRFQPAFGPPPFQQQRSLPPFADFPAYGLPQMPAFGPNNRFGPQAPYGSPLFTNEMPMMDQQHMFGGISPPAFSRRPLFAQFGGGPSPPMNQMNSMNQMNQMNPIMPMHQSGNGMFGAGLPPAFANLPSSYGMNNPVGGRAPFQREAGVPMTNDGFLEPFNAEMPGNKQKRSITKS